LRYWELLEVKSYLQQFKRVNSIYRVDYDTVKIEFDRGKNIYFNMKRGGSFIYMREGETVRPNRINSPFDTLLSNRFNRTEIKKIEIINSDKILRITVASSNRYKSTTSSIQFEFTGKHTNIILLDEDEKVIEALHHISEYQSIRFVKIGKKLENPPKPKFQFQTKGKIEDIEKYLSDNYRNYISNLISARKEREIKKILKKLASLKKRLSKIESEEKLIKKAEKYKKIGELILIHLYTLPKYDNKLEIIDFDGKKIEFERPKEAKDNSHMAEIFFRNSKKFKRQSENSKIERVSISEKIEFLEKMVTAIKNSSTIEEINILTERREERRGDKSDKNEPFQTFWIEGHKIMVGRNQRENIEVLDKSKSNDIWIHLKDRPSSHVVVVTDRREVKEAIIREAGRLCAKFSLSEKGRYLIDYTQRRYVRIQSGSNVLYTNYKTIQIEI